MKFHFFDYSGIAYDATLDTLQITCTETGEEPQVQKFGTLLDFYRAMKSIISIRDWEKV